MSHSLLQTEGGSAAQTVTLNKPMAVDALPIQLREHLEQLRLILPVISDAVIALRRQNADFDTDVAYDLTEQACEPLNYEIERIEFLLASPPRRRRQREVRA
jgi:hypothetical protein